MVVGIERLLGRSKLSQNRNSVDRDEGMCRAR